MTMNKLNINSLKLVAKDISDISELIYENNGSFRKDEQTLLFEDGETEVSIDYTICVDADVEEIPGDWMTPSYTDAEIKSIGIEDVIIYIDGDEYNPTSEELKLVVSKIEELI